MRKHLQNYILLKLLIASVGVVTIFAFFGPYNYRFADGWGLFLYYFSLLIFGIPLLFCGDRNYQLSKKNHTLTKAVLSKTGKNILIVVLILSLLGSVVFFAECIRLFSVDVLFEEADYRLEFSVNRSMLSEFAEVFSYLGPACFLIIQSCENTQTGILKRMSYAALFACGLTGLLLGARWKIFVCAMLFFFGILFQSKNSYYFSTARVWVKRIVILIVVIAIISRIITLFEVRGLHTANELHRFFLGDMDLTPFAFSLYYETNGAINALYRFIDYVGQAPFVFSNIFELYYPDQMYLGAFMFRPIGYLLNLFGFNIPLMSDIAEATFTGMYSGTFYYLIVDFGIVGALLVFFFTGVVFAYIERHRDTSKYAKVLFPMICTVVICSPIFYLYNVGGVDWMMFWLIALLFVLFLFNGWNKLSKH